MATLISPLRRHPVRTGIVAAALLAIAVFVVVWFEPQALFIDDKVDEAVPVVSEARSAPAELSELARGTFRGLDHGASGQAVILELADGRRILRFEDLDVSNGPDLRVYLATAPSNSPESSFNDDFVDLGALKGNVGDQNYDIPAGTDLARFKSAVVWCRRFSAGFAVAPVET